MISIDQMKVEINKKLHPTRYNHTLAVLEVAIDMAERFDVNKEDTIVAALLHDYAKNFSDDEMLSQMNTYGIEKDTFTIDCINLAHGQVAAELVQHDFKIKNIDVINAIRNHTFARAGMSDLEKVIYLADMIEPSRDFDGVEEIRTLAKINLDDALLLALNHTIGYLMSKNRPLHPNAVLARNELIRKKDI